MSEAVLTVVDQRVPHLRDDGRRRLSLQLWRRRRGRGAATETTIQGQLKTEGRQVERRADGLTEGSLDDGDLRGGGVDTGERAPIVDDESGSEHIRSSVDSSGLDARETSSLSAFPPKKQLSSVQMC